MAQLTSLDDFLNSEVPEQRPERFVPFAFYNEMGDALEIFLAPDERVAERVDQLFTVLVAEHDQHKVVGIVVKHVKEWLGDANDVRALYKTGRAKISLLLLGAKFAFECHLQRGGFPAGAPSIPDQVQELLSAHGNEKVEIRNRCALVGAEA